MNIICVICSDLLAQADEIFYTRCGHVFHLHCLTQWLERSKTCPQCREKVTQSKIHRLYFTFSTTEVAHDNTASLQERVDSLKFQILLKEKDIRYYTSKKVTLEKQNANLRKEVRKVESEMNQKNSAIYALKEQTRYFKEQSADCDKLKKEITRLKNKIEELRPIQVLLHSPTTDVDEMVGKSRDPTVLLTYISVMKKEILAGLNKCKQLRRTIKTLQEELTKVSAECDSLLDEQAKRMQLEEDLAFCESKNMAFQKRIEELESMLGINENSITNVTQSTQDDTGSKESVKPVGRKRSSKCQSTCLSKKETILSSTESFIEDIQDASTNSLMETDRSTSSKKGHPRYSAGSNSPTAPKRLRTSYESKQSDISIASIDSNDSKCMDSSKFLKSKKPRESSVKVKHEKSSSKLKHKNNSIIDLT